MKTFQTNEKLPNHGDYVLAFFPNRKGYDRHARNNEHKWAVVKFIRGIDTFEREKLSDDSFRKIDFRPEDLHGDNTVPYFWEMFCGHSFNGQEVSCWCYFRPNAKDQPAARCPSVKHRNNQSPARPASSCWAKRNIK